MNSSVDNIKIQAKDFLTIVSKMEIENAAAVRSREQLENTINQLIKNNESNKEALDIVSNAIVILRQVSDEAVGQAYQFLQQSLNGALAKMFSNTTRKIEIKESIRANQYPQLELILHVGNGKTRSLKADSGHGLAQIVSVLSILSLIVITGSRRILVMDEVVSGLSVRNRQILTDILWTFTEIGFQFIINDHGYIPKGSYVHHLEMVGDVSGVKQRYLAKKGVYLQGNGDSDYGYNEVSISEMIEQSIAEEQANETNNSGDITEVISI